jgi:hypothetical protein
MYESEENVRQCYMDESETLMIAYLCKHGHMPAATTVQFNNGEVFRLLPDLFKQQYTKKGIAQTIMFRELQIKVDGEQTDFLFSESDDAVVVLELKPTGNKLYVTMHRMSPFEIEISSITIRPRIFDL